MSEWQPIETAPVGKRFLGSVPIEGHRLLICLKTDMGLVLDESLKPSAFPVSHWMPLPEPPK